MEASQALVVHDHRSQESLNELARMIETGEGPSGEVHRDPADVSREIIQQILAASSVEETERQVAESWRDFPGVPMEIRGFVWRPSTFTEEGGHPVFVVVRVNDLSAGVPRVLTTGAGNVMAQLVALARLGALVGAVRQLAFDQTAQGYKVYFLKTPEGHAPDGHLTEPGNAKEKAKAKA